MKLKTVNLIAGIFLLIVTVIEVLQKKAEFELEIEHGLLIYAMAHVLNSTIEVLEGISKIRKFKTGED